MTADARAALDQFVASLERHLTAASQRRSELDPAVVEAYDALASAFERYDEALFTSFDEVTPFVLSEDEDFDEDDELDDEDDELDDAGLSGGAVTQADAVIDLDHAMTSDVRARETF